MELSLVPGRVRSASTLAGLFRAKDVFLHNEGTIRRIHVSSRAQILGASSLGAVVGLSFYAAVQLTAGLAFGNVGTREISVARMDAQVAAMRTEMVKIRHQATEHARRLEERQAFLDAAITGQLSPSAMVPASAGDVSPQVGRLIQPLTTAENRQDAFAIRAAAQVDQSYEATAAVISKLGLAPARFHKVAGATGGPYEPVLAGEPTPAIDAKPDPQFRALFQSWKRLDQLQRGAIAIPSQRPVDAVTFTSGFGVRSDPFRGGAAMHAGVDIPGATGTSIYATADGIVGRAQWASGYGNLVELDHGRGIQTRYGHLSAILVQPGTRVSRGQLIARMGSTGRSTGPHLHYEVRLDGHAVNPMPFLQTSAYLTAMQERAVTGPKLAVGGPVIARK